MTLNQYRWCRVCAAAWVFTAVLLPKPAGAQGTVDILATTGSNAPNGNGIFLTFRDPVLNSAGQAAFRASLQSTSGGMDDDFGIYRASSQATTQIDREFFSGLGPRRISFFSDSPAINDAGQVAYYRTSTVGLFPPTRQLVRGDGVTKTVLASQGDTAPDSDGEYNDFDFEIPAINASGQVAFIANLTNTANNQGVFRAEVGPVTQVARTGQAPPDGNGNFTVFGAGSSLNNSGQVAFRGTLNSTNNSPDDVVGYYLGAGGPLTQLQRAGNPAPDGDGTFDASGTFSDPLLNNAGQAVFRAPLTGTQLGSFFDDSGLLRADSGGIDTIARGGRPTPDGLDVFAPIFNSIVMNQGGQVAFQGSFLNTSTTTNQGLFLGDGTDATTLLREGQASPDGNGVFSTLTTRSINDAAIPQVAFTATLTGTVGGFTDDEGLYITNGIDTLLVAREGQAFAGSTITSAFISVNRASAGSGRAPMNDVGQITYRVFLANGGQAIALFSIPDLNWSSTTSGFLNNPANFDTPVVPNSFHDVTIAPANALTVTVPTGGTILESLTLGDGSNHTATLLLNGLSSGDLRSIEPAVINASGDLSLQNGRTFSAPSVSNAGLIRGDGTVGANLTNLATGQVRVTAGQNLVLTGTNHTNAGSIESVGGQVTVNGPMTNQAATGLIAARDAVLRFNDGLTNNGSVSLSFGHSDVFGDVTNNGNVVVSGSSDVTFFDDIANNAAINISAGSTAVFFGALTGNGTAGGGDVFLEGDTRPGFSPGIMSFGGDVNFGFFSSLTTELGGLTAGSGFDQLVIAGDVALSGTLDVTGFGGFTLSPGMTFDIITFGGNLTGAFNNVVNSTGLSGLTLSVTSDADSVNLVLGGLIGDLNLDGFVGIEDLNLVLGVWNEPVPAGNWQSGDPSGDGFVGIEDLNQVLGNWNAGKPPSQAATNIPEPGSLAILTLAGLSLIHTRRW